MGNLLDILLCGLLVLGELIASMSIALFIQLIVYQLTGFSIFNNILKLLDKFEIYLDKKFDN